MVYATLYISSSRKNDDSTTKHRRWNITVANGGIKEYSYELTS